MRGFYPTAITILAIATIVITNAARHPRIRRAPLVPLPPLRTSYIPPGQPINLNIGLPRLDNYQYDNQYAEEQSPILSVYGPPVVQPPPDDPAGLYGPPTKLYTPPVKTTSTTTTTTTTPTTTTTTTTPTTTTTTTPTTTTTTTPRTTTTTTTTTPRTTTTTTPTTTTKKGYNYEPPAEGIPRLNYQSNYY